MGCGVSLGQDKTHPSFVYVEDKVERMVMEKKWCASSNSWYPHVVKYDDDTTWAMDTPLAIAFDSVDGFMYISELHCIYRVDRHTGKCQEFSKIDYCRFMLILPLQHRNATRFMIVISNHNIYLVSATGECKIYVFADNHVMNTSGIMSVAVDYMCHLYVSYNISYHRPVCCWKWSDEEDDTLSCHELSRTLFANTLDFDSQNHCIAVDSKHSRVFSGVHELMTLDTRHVHIPHQIAIDRATDIIYVVASIYTSSDKSTGAIFKSTPQQRMEQYEQHKQHEHYKTEYLAFSDCITSDVTIALEAYPLTLEHIVLPFSNWPPGISTMITSYIPFAPAVAVWMANPHTRQITRISI